MSGVRAFLYVSLATLAHIVLINTGWFDSVTTELGYEMYAERVHSLPFPSLPPMPFNTLVNAGYFIVGAAWLPALTRSRDEQGQEFCWYSMFYSGIQLARIVLQTQRAAVLDQWITTTIFCHVTLWISSHPCGGVVTRSLNLVPRPLLLLLSFFSYFLALLFPIGFDISLAAHILLAVTVGLEAHNSRGNSRSSLIFGKAVASCVGFVVLKVLDLPLKEYWTPNCVSGHFLSKLCDVGQIYYAAELVYILNAPKQHRE